MKSVKCLICGETYEVDTLLEDVLGIEPLETDSPLCPDCYSNKNLAKIWELNK